MFYPYPEDAWIRICFTVRKCHAVIRLLPGVDMILLTALPAGAPPQCCPPPSRDGRWQLRAAGGAACPTTWLWRRWRGSPWRIWPPPAWAVIPVTNYNFYSTWKKINLWRDAGIEPGRAACARKYHFPRIQTKPTIIIPSLGQSFFIFFYFYCKKHVVILNCLDQRITGYLTRKNIVKTFLIENKIMLSFYSSFVWKKIILSELTAVPNKNIILWRHSANNFVKLILLVWKLF